MKGHAGAADRQQPQADDHVGGDRPEQRPDAVTRSISAAATSAPWILLKDKLTETTYEWDTRSVADGRYEVQGGRVRRAANAPGKGKTASARQRPGPGGQHPAGRRRRRSPSSAGGREGELPRGRPHQRGRGADYASTRPRTGRRCSLRITSGIRPEETAAFNIRGLQPGNHQVTIRATDAKGNQAFESVFVTVQGPAAAK